MPKESLSQPQLNSIAETLLDELRTYGLKLDIKFNDIKEGVGDAVC